MNKNSLKNIFKNKQGFLTLFSLTFGFILLFTIFISTILLNSTNKEQVIEDHTTDTSISQEDIVEIKVEEPILADSPALPNSYSPQHPGTKVVNKSNTIIDYSNITEGYVMVKSDNSNTVKIKAQVHGPSQTAYTYDIPYSKWVAFPLSDGNGEYIVTILKNTTGNKYALLNSIKFTVTLKNEFAPFLYSNQYVDFDYAVNTVEKAKELVGNETDTLKQIEKVYNFVINNLTYDYDKAKTVKSGYLPILDDVLTKKKGICFDYAALMAGMLRSQGIPCKLVTGYVGTAYHAWISVYSDELGWIDGAIYFDGNNWQRLDPTFASGNNNSQTILNYIKDNSHYKVKHFY